MDITVEELNNMTDEEVANLNRTLGKKVLKKFIIFTVVKVGLVVGLHIVVKQLEKKYQEN